MRNTFNWMVDDQQTSLTQADFLGFPFNGLNSAVPNPWAQNNFPLKPSPYDTSVIDFSPQDGWELVYRGFGKGLDNGPIDPSQRPEFPCFILYNKFEATLRVFTMANIVGYDVANVILKFQDGFNKAITFSNNTAKAQALDQYTTITELASSSTHPNSYNRWFYGDFKMAYDPCVCDFDSRIEVYVEFVETSDIKLYGRFIGTSTPIDYLKGGQNTAALDPNFLSSMDYRFGNTKIEAGALIYKNVNTLAADYDKRMKDYKMEKQDADKIKAWSTALTLGAYIATGGKAFLAAKMKSIIIGGTALGKDKSKDILEAIIYGGMAAGKYTDYYAGRLKEEAKMPGMPSVIQGEMKLQGTLTDHDRVYRTTFGSPGSSNTYSFDLINTPKYPLYNEHLGVFALYYKPKVQVYYKFSDTRVFSPGGGPVEGENNGIDREKITDRHEIGFRLENDIKYSINPAIKPNMDNTKVLFALRMKHQLPSNAKYIENLNWEIRHSKDLPNGTEYYLQSPYLPASCIEKLITLIDFTSISTNTIDQDPSVARGRNYILPTDLELCVMLVLESNELGKDESPNRAVHMFTYPIESSIIGGEEYNFNTFTQGYSSYRYTMTSIHQPELNFNSVSITSSANTYAKKLITFSNGTMNILGGSSFYEAGEEIKISTEYEIIPIGGEVTLQVFDLADNPPCSYDNHGLVTNKNEIAIFCSGDINSKYKGNISLSKTSPKPIKNELKDKPELPKINFKIYPNPTSNNAIIAYELDENKANNICIYNLAGALIKKIVLANNSNKEVNIETEILEAGVYLVTLNASNGYSETKKLIIAK